jgi:peptidyl-prolyl cis-trans isomerase C
MQHFAVVLLAAALAGTVCAEDKPASPAAHKPDDVVARVGDSTIKWEDLDKACTAYTRQFSGSGRTFPESQMDRLRYDLLGEMITREVLFQAAKGAAPTNLEAQVKLQLEQTKAQAGGEEAFAAALADIGGTPAEFEKRIRETLLIQNSVRDYVEPRVKVTEDDAKKFYDTNRGKFATPEQVRASHILILVPPEATAEVRTQKLAQIKAAAALAKSGEKFEDLAKKFSEDPGSAANGGDLRYFGRGQMVKEFEEAAFALKPGEISDIVTTQYGYHILKLTDRRPAGERNFAEVKDDIERYLKNLKGQEVAQQYVKELRDKAKIEILIAKPQAPVPPPAAGKELPTVETAPVPAPKP